MEQRLKGAFTRRQKCRIAGSGRTPAAVLVPIFAKEEQCFILFTQRTDKVREHKGQVSFPGGSHHEADRTLADTALRESAEEIGLAPEAVRILGELDDVVTRTSNYVVSPFVALISYPYPFKVDGWEVEEIIEVPISALLDEERRQRHNGGDGSYSYNYQGRVIWGATGQILHQFLDTFSRAMAG